MTTPDSDVDTDQYAQLQPEDTLSDRGVADVLDEGYSPPERPWNSSDHETLDERLADEEPDTWNAGDPADAGGETDGDDDPDTDLIDDGEVGTRRAGRLVVDDPVFDGESGGTKDLTAGDAGIDGAGASAEEAAVHVVDDEG